jgi:hypothetical protein
MIDKVQHLIPSFKAQTFNKIPILILFLNTSYLIGDVEVSICSALLITLKVMLSDHFFGIIISLQTSQGIVSKFDYSQLLLPYKLTLNEYFIHFFS